MKLTQVRHFVALAERRNMRLAAHQLGVSTRTLARNVRVLEQQLGAALLDASDASVTLTPVGDAFFRRTAAALLELDHASDHVRHGRDLASGNVCIASSADAHASVLPGVLKAFHTRFPDTHLQVIEGLRPPFEGEVEDGVIDFYVGPVYSHWPTADLWITKLGDADRIVVGRTGHPLSNAVSLSELANAQWIAPSREELCSLFRRHGLAEPIITVEAQAGLGMLSAAAACDALLIAPKAWMSLIDRLGVLAPFRSIGPLDCPPTFLVARKEPALRPAAAYLHDLIVEKAGSFPIPSRSEPG